MAVRAQDEKKLGRRYLRNFFPVFYICLRR